MREIVFIISGIISGITNYEFFGANFIFKVLMWSVYYYHEMLVFIDKQENGKKAYGTHSCQKIDF